jgi:crotonobetainyl-CoA:carnitine CoA-transferase CaiB-like acyl-CoA transferase
MLAHLNQEFVSVLNLGIDFKRPQSGIGHPGSDAPFGVYETRDGRFVTIAMTPFDHLVKTLGAEELLVYDDLETLYSQRDEIWAKLNEVTKTFDCDPLLDKLLDADVWTAEVKDIRQASEDPQVKHMNMLQTYTHPLAGEVRVVGPAVKMSETPATIDRPAPMIGEHGREILAEYGISDAEIAALEKAGDVTVQTVN